MPKKDEKREQIETAVQRCYSTWGTSYYEDYYGRSAPYPPLHADLVRGLIIDSGAKTLLDAGCGPASFLRRFSGDGLELFGFDLTVEMVDEGKRVFRELGLDPGRVWQGSVLDSRAYFGPAERAVVDGYDAAVCVGVIPHVSSEDDVTVFRNLANALRPRGVAIVEGRNQLFSLFTMNRPSYEFIRGELMRADDLLRRNPERRSEIEATLEQLKAQFRMDLPPVRTGKAGEPGYDEIVSRTHNPFVARAQFEAAGFDNVRVLFYHYHAMPPMFAGAFPELFLRESIAMEDPNDWRGYFMASAFVLVGSRI